MFKKIVLYFNTVRYLKFAQIAYRCYYYFRGRVEAPDINSSCVLRRRSGHLLMVRKKGCLFDKKLKFIGVEVPLTDDLWGPSGREALEVYNIHYFDYLNGVVELDSNFALNLIRDWINFSSLNARALDSYPTSLRTVNWIKFLIHNEVNDSLINDSLIYQGWSIYRNLEYHILGNHLFANAKALIYIGTFLDCESSVKFLSRGIKIFLQELDEQILGDGGHFELSPMYHAIFLEDLLDLLALIKVFPFNSQLRDIERVTYEKVNLMGRWLRSLIHPDGDFSFFNDTALNVAPTYSELRNFGLNLGIDWEADVNPDFCPSESGYVRLGRGDFNLIFDAANVGPDYLPGHAHADTLSFELSIGLDRVFVNSGISCYGTSEERVRQRSGSAHNVLRIGHKDSSEVWSGFRVARRAKVLDRKVCHSNTWAEATHNGFCRFFSRNLHTRRLELRDDSLIITDTVDIDGQREVEIYFHLHPDVIVEENEREFVFNIIGHGLIRFKKSCTLSYSLKTSSYHEGFGEGRKNLMIYCQGVAQVNTSFIHVLEVGK